MRRPVTPGDFTLYSMLSEPSFSPDGRRLAFSVKRANLDEDGYDSDIHVADIRTGRSSRFTTGKKDSDPKWSPDGRSILFTSRRGLKKEDKGNALYVISAGGGEARLLRRSEDGVDTARWSPDSKSVYFLSTVGKKAKDDVKVVDRVTFWFNGLGFIYDRRKHLFRVDLGSEKVRQITSGSIDVSDFAVSHDGRLIAFIASSDDLKPYISDLYLSDAGGKGRRRLTRSNMELTTVAWSPDDRLLALTGDDLPAGFASHSRIWTVNPKTRVMEKIDDVDLNKAKGLNYDVRAHAHGPGNIVWYWDGIYYLEADGGAVSLGPHVGIEGVGLVPVDPVDERRLS